MPIASFSSTEATSNLRRNRDGLWPDGRRRGQRLEGVAQVSCRPSFQFSADDQIMTMGSCFAREIETALSARGFTLPALDLHMPEDERHSSVANDILNKYTIQSMANEIEWAFEKPPFEPTDFYMTAGDGLWHDAQLVQNLKPAPLDRVIERREAVLDVMRRLPECRVIVVTLGLAEAWFDRKLGIYLNSMPPQPALAAEPDRFRLDILGYDDIASGIDRLLGLFKRYGRPDHRVLMTVSPVPFKATFTGDDALAANSYSKSVQRAAVEEAVRRHDHVDYFPSYEVVTLTDRKIAFTLDNIHVNRDVVGAIMQRVVENYVPGAEAVDEPEQATIEASRDPFAAPALMGEGHAALERGDAALAATYFTSLLYRHGTSIKQAERDNARAGLVRAMMVANRLKDAIQIASDWLENEPGNALAAVMLSKVMEKSRKMDRAIEYSQKACAIDPVNARWQVRLASLYQRSGDHESARTAARRALDLEPHDEEARRIFEAAA